MKKHKITYQYIFQDEVATTKTIDQSNEKYSKCQFDHIVKHHLVDQFDELEWLSDLSIEGEEFDVSISGDGGIIVHRYFVSDAI